MKHAQYAKLLKIETTDVTSDLQSGTPKVIPLIFTATGAWAGKEGHGFMMNVAKTVAVRQQSKDSLKKKHLMSEVAKVLTEQMGMMLRDTQTAQCGPEEPTMVTMEDDEPPEYTG